MKSKSILPRALKLAIVSSVLGSALSLAQAQVVTYFPMTVNVTSDGTDSLTAYFQGRLNDGVRYETEEYGAQVTLASGLASVFKGISFYYYADYNLVGGLTYRVYDNDGPLVGGFASPGTLLIQDTLDIASNPGGSLQRTTLDFAYDPANTAPSTFTFTVEFAGVDGTHHAGLLTSQATPVIGSHPIPYWQTFDQGTTWQLASIVEVPEVNSYALVAGVLALFGVYRKARR